MPRPNSHVLPGSVAASVASVDEASMEDECVVTRGEAVRVYDAANDRYAYATGNVVYKGKCRHAQGAASATAALAVFGETQINTTAALIVLPLSSVEGDLGSPAFGDRVEIETEFEEFTYEVYSVHRSSSRTAVYLLVERVQK